MLLLVTGRTKGYKSTCLHGKHVEVIGQAMVLRFQKWEGSQATSFMNLTLGYASFLTADDRSAARSCHTCSKQG